MFVLFVALLSTASAAKYCCTPDQWHGQLGLIMGTVTNGKGTFIEGSMNITYDGVNRIVAYDQALNVDGVPVYQRVVNDHKNNAMFVINAEGCTRSNAAPWISGCIPDNATETTDNARYGFGDNSVKVKGYFTRYEGYDVYMAVTADTCVPVSEILTGNLEALTGQAYGTTETMEALTFANIKPGIPTGSGPFYIPAQCASQQSGQAVGRRSLYFV